MEQIALRMLVTNVGFPTLEAGSMKAVDRIMAAYAKTHRLTHEQADIVRKELSLFVDQLLCERLPERSKNQTGTMSDSN
jgi:hypothetical protein